MKVKLIDKVKLIWTNVKCFSVYAVKNDFAQIKFKYFYFKVSYLFQCVICLF